MSPDKIITFSPNRKPLDCYDDDDRSVWDVVEIIRDAILTREEFQVGDFIRRGDWLGLARHSLAAHADQLQSQADVVEVAALARPLVARGYEVDGGAVDLFCLGWRIDG